MVNWAVSGPAESSVAAPHVRVVPGVACRGAHCERDLSDGSGDEQPRRPGPRGQGVPRADGTRRDCRCCRRGERRRPTGPPGRRGGRGGDHACGLRGREARTHLEIRRPLWSRFIADIVAGLSATEAAIKKPLSKIKNTWKYNWKMKCISKWSAFFDSVFFGDVVPAIEKPLSKTSILRVWNAS